MNCKSHCSANTENLEMEEQFKVSLPSENCNLLNDFSSYDETNQGQKCLVNHQMKNYKYFFYFLVPSNSIAKIGEKEPANQNLETILNELKIQQSDDLFTIKFRFSDFSSVANFLCGFAFLLEFIQSNASGIELCVDCRLSDDNLHKDNILKQYGAMKRSFLLLFKQANCAEKVLYWKTKNYKTVNFITFDPPHDEAGSFITNFIQKSIKNGESG